MARAKQRWLPAFLIPLALLAAVLVGSVQAGASPSLPPKSAEEIIAMAVKTDVRALSGKVSQVANLGLPQLPGAGPSAEPGAASLLGLLAGTHDARVYVDAPSKVRLQILDALAERDVVVNGADAWFYNSADNSAVHTTLPARRGSAGTDGPADTQGPTAQAVTPESLAKRVLTAIDASTEVTPGEPATVAGRSAYTLLVKPRSTGTLVDSAAINVDAETGLPLAITVRAKGQSDPAFSLSYTELELGAPDASLFTFVPPEGAKVTEQTLPSSNSKPAGSPPASKHATKTTGVGWESVVSLPAGALPTAVFANPQISQALQPVKGGRALTTALVNILVLDDGRVFAGMVPLDRLESAAASG